MAAKKTTAKGTATGRATGNSPIRNYTRAVKNAKYLEKVAPHILAAGEPGEGPRGMVPAHVLGQIHRLRHDAPELRGYPALAEFLRTSPIPGPGRAPRGALFSGTIHFVKVTFRTPGGNLVFSDADMAMMVQYAQHAIVPISQAAAQYGPNTVSVSGTVLTYTATLTGTSYTDADLQGWVNDIVSSNSLPSNTCIGIASPQGLTANNVGGNAGYHFKANVPY